MDSCWPQSYQSTQAPSPRAGAIGYGGEAGLAAARAGGVTGSGAGAREGAGTTMAAALCRRFEVLIEVGFGDASRAEPIWARASRAAPGGSLPAWRFPFALRTAALVMHRMTVATERTRRAGRRQTNNRYALSSPASR